MLEEKLRVLMIGAHPDDCELETGGIACKYRKLGHIVKFVSATTGDTGHYKLSGGELARIRAAETRRACAIIGAESQVLDIGSNKIEADIATRERFICLIREFRPHLIFTHRPNDYHPDHRRVATLVQDSSYAIRIPNVCPLTPYLTYSPIILYMVDSFKKPNEFEPDVMVDIDDVMDTKIKMVDCHVSQVYEWLPWMDGQLEQVPNTESERIEWLAERQGKRDARVAGRFRRQLVERYGEERGNSIRYAEAFEVSEYGAGLPKDKISIYFPF